MSWFRKNFRHNLRKKRQVWGLTIFFVVFLVLLSFLLKPEYFGLKVDTVSGADDDNISGFAKVLDDDSWISFNCISDPFLGGQNIFTFTFPMQFSFPTCDENAYGVNIASDGSFSGYALSDKYGPIDFAPASPPETLEYNSSTGLVTGYAKITDLGENGWLRFHEAVGGQPYDPVSIDDYNGDFEGYAYNNTIGWVSFNCENEGGCGVAEYNVNYYRPLIAGALSAPNWSIAQACESKLALKAILRWNFTGDPQTAYQIIIDDDPVIDDDEVFYDTGKITSESTQYVCPNSGDTCELMLDHTAPGFSEGYSKSYYWWLKLWDTHDNETEWVQFNTNLGHQVTDNSDYNNQISSNPNLTFTTYKHGMPAVYFSWSPQEINMGEAIDFDSDGSGTYSDYRPNYYSVDYYNDCDSASCEYLWSADGDAVISNPTNATTTITFNSINNNNDRVYLQITDDDDYVCGASSDLLDINLDLPDWRESSGY
ncbi:MAG: hypothetical protein K9M44_04330 [Candidatus Pacebacteria bacterium]|nr:hypothetical protein [Candidatus Paceibacterota bacterium]